MLGTANAIPDLPTIPNTTDVIEAISRQSLQVASLIHEYTKLPWAGNSVAVLLGFVKSNNGLFVARTVKIQIPGDLKSRIDICRKNCAALKDDFYGRVHIDTNTRTKEIGAGLHKIGTFYFCDHELSESTLANIGRRLETITDDQLGSFEFLCSSIIIQFSQRKTFASGYPRPTAPRISMKQTTNVKLTPVPGFSKAIDLSSGEKILGFFGLREKVGSSMIYLNASDKNFRTSGKREKHSMVSLVFMGGPLGKPMGLLLSSSIIDKLSQENPPFGIAYFFFDGRDSQSELQLHDKLIRSLISQFSHQRGGIPTELADLYKRCGDHHQPSIHQLQNTLRDILDGFSGAYIVVDALDECTDREKTLIQPSRIQIVQRETFIFWSPVGRREILKRSSGRLIQTLLILEKWLQTETFRTILNFI